MESQPAGFNSNPALRNAAQVAKAALLRLATNREEPNPVNYARAWYQEGGERVESQSPAAAASALGALVQRAFPTLPRDQRERVVAALARHDYEPLAGALASTPAATGAAGGEPGGRSGGSAWGDIIERLVRGLERRSPRWTYGRKKERLQHVVEGSRADAGRLRDRIDALLASWESDKEDDAAVEVAQPNAAAADASSQAQARASAGADPHAAAEAPRTAWMPVIDELDETIHTALPEGDAKAADAWGRVRALTSSIPSAGPQKVLAAEIALACEDIRRMLRHRHRITGQLAELAQDLTGSLVDLAEDDSWVSAQCVAMQAELGEGLTSRGIRSVSQLLHATRQRQQELRAERAHARESLKQLIHRMLQDIGELGEQTGRFHESTARYADVIGQADSLERLAGAVREMVEETRTVHSLVSATQQRLRDEHRRAAEMTSRVQVLEDELRRLSNEVSTDQLTQVANRRGLIANFEVEISRAAREGTRLAVGLLDIDNFKKLNDTLGHSTGDEALKFLARRVQQSLRPGDTVARFGGEEFVVLLPGTQAEEAQRVLTRLQRSLSADLFMHENKQTLVTFSAGVTQHRSGESLEITLERADEALYEAKRTGKNRTCVV